MPDTKLTVEQKIEAIFGPDRARKRVGPIDVSEWELDFDVYVCAILIETREEFEYLGQQHAAGEKVSLRAFLLQHAVVDEDGVKLMATTSEAKIRKLESAPAERLFDAALALSGLVPGATEDAAGNS